MKAVLHPITAEWEEGYSRPSDGALLLATRDPAAEDIWPGATGLYISQVMPDGSRRARFGGYVEKFTGAGGGATTVGLLSIDTWLNNRIFGGPDAAYNVSAVYEGGPIPTVGSQLLIAKPTSPTTQTIIYDEYVTGGMASAAAQFVNLARGGLEGEGQVGVPTLTGVVDPPDHKPFTLTSYWWDHKNIGQQIREMVESEMGIKYWVEHVWNDGYWNSVIHFSDEVGTARDYTIMSDREAWQYGLDVDAQDKATRVYGIGAGEENYITYSVAYDGDMVDNLPERQAVIAWKDQTEPDRIDALTRGWVTDHRDPVTTPSATIVGLPDYDPDAEDYDPSKGFPGPEILRPGDTFNVQIGYGAITVRDLQVRCTAVAWKLETDQTAQRTIAMQSVIRPNSAIRTQTPARIYAATESIEDVQGGDVVNTVSTTVDPWPKPGLVTTVKTAALDEISGMELSQSNRRSGLFVWVFNDEQETPQVSLLNLRDGNVVASFTPNPGVSAAPVGDPEAIRLARSSGILVLADTGDNDGTRPTSGANQPHLLALPEPKGAGAKGLLPAVKYPIAYPGGAKLNSETLLIHPTTENVYLVTKEDKRARVYGFGPLSSMSTSNNVGTLVATLSDTAFISDGTHTWDGNRVLLRSVGRSETLVYDATKWNRLGLILTPPMKKSEAICVESTCSFLTTTENKGSAGAPVYRVLIDTKYGAKCGTPAGPPGTGTGGGTTTATVPSQVIDMSQWKLQLPI